MNASLMDDEWMDGLLEDGWTDRQRVESMDS